MLKEISIKIFVQVVATLITVIILFLLFEFIKMNKKPCGCSGKQETMPDGSAVDKTVSTETQMPGFGGGLFSLSGGGGVQF